MARVTGIAYKCGCGSVWCPACFIKRQAKIHFGELKSFDWTKTRQVVLTIDRRLFKDGREAWEYVTAHKKIAGLIRNLKRAFGIKITKWKWFLEWHQDGFPHWHLFIEVENKGRAGMIGGDRIRHYWGLGKWTHESHIKNQGHWNFITGYFQKHGYFKSKDKKHQIKLPGWAESQDGLKIRRSGSNVRARQAKSEFIRAMNYFQKRGDETEIVDIKTGEVIKERKKKLIRRRRTYKAMFEACGQTTRIKLISDHTIMIFETDVPYRKIREKVPGHYEKGIGYTFNMSAKLFNYLFDKVLSVPFFKNARDISFLEERIEAWEEVRKERGYFEYSKVYG